MAKSSLQKLLEKLKFRQELLQPIAVPVDDKQVAVRSALEAASNNLPIGSFPKTRDEFVERERRRKLDLLIQHYGGGSHEDVLLKLASDFLPGFSHETIKQKPGPKPKAEQDTDSDLFKEVESMKMYNAFVLKELDEHLPPLTDREACDLLKLRKDCPARWRAMSTDRMMNVISEQRNSDSNRRSSDLFRQLIKNVYDPDPNRKHSDLDRQIANVYSDPLRQSAIFFGPRSED